MDDGIKRIDDYLAFWAAQCPDKVAVTYDSGFWVFLFQVYKQRQQRGLLCKRAGVLRLLVVTIHATDITNAYRMSVVTSTMRTDYIHVAPWLDMAVSVYQIMITDVRPTLCLVPSSDVIYGVVAALWRGRTMDDNLVDCSL